MASDTNARATRRRLRDKTRVALVCAGGGVTGAIYEIGCLRALEDLLDRSILDLDFYVGISGGAVVSSLLANGVSPGEMYDELLCPSGGPLGSPGPTLFRVGAGDYVRRGLRAPKVLGDAVRAALSGEGSLSEAVFSLLELLPPGVVDNSGLREYLANLFSQNGRTDSFARLRRTLYLVAVDIDTGEAVAFGEPGHRSVPISKAVQASTALPGLYRPVEIAGRDFVDGGVKKTAHIDLAIRHGADLVICINPLVPVLNNGERGVFPGKLADRGISYVLDQTLRIMAHGRMQYGMERYANRHPEVDILLIEPVRSDMRMFRYNIMRYSARQIVARYGYRSARHSFEEHRAAYARMLRRHGIGLRRRSRLPKTPPRHVYHSTLTRTLGDTLKRLDARLERRTA